MITGSLLAIAAVGAAFATVFDQGRDPRRDMAYHFAGLAVVVAALAALAALYWHGGCT